MNKVYKHFVKLRIKILYFFFLKKQNVEETSETSASNFKTN